VVPTIMFVMTKLSCSLDDMMPNGS
jgi:hypothetical protein